MSNRVEILTYSTMFELTELEHYLKQSDYSKIYKKTKAMFNWQQIRIKSNF